MPTPIHDIYAEQGSSLEIEFLYETASEIGVPLDDYTHAHMQVRRSIEQTNNEVVLDVEDNTAAVMGVTGYEGEFVLTYGGITGNVFLSIAAETMDAVPAGKYFYEIKLVNPIEPLKLLRGRFIVDPGAIR